MISKDNLKKLIEPNFYNDLKKDNYEKKTIKATSLLTHTRLDMAFKLLYLEILDKDVKFAQVIYEKHIKAFSLGKFTEPGNEEKNSIDKFINEFHKTFNDIKNNGFDSSKTFIPLSKNRSIANGAHRVASAIYLDKTVDCVDIETCDHIYDYKFFYNRNVSVEVLDIGVTKFVEYADNLHIAFLWPTAKGHNEEIEQIIPNIIYRKEMTLNLNGAHNLLSQIYYGEEWLGSVENNFKGSKGKLLECFKSLEPVRVIAFQADNLDEVLKIKNKVRKIFNIGKHSIHITDTKEEAIRVARVVFNDNSIHFLNYAKPNKYISTHQKIEEFKKFIEKNNLDNKDLLIDSSLILSCYGLREAKDIDFICSDNSKIKINFEYINIHDEELKNYNESKNELIYNPRNYFYFNNLKFISFTQLYKMKRKRDEEKDKNDCKIMEALIEGDGFKKIINKLKQRFYYEKIKLKSTLVKMLKFMGIYKLIREIYQKINPFNNKSR